MDLVPAALRTRWLQNRKADIGRTADPLFGAIADVARTARQAVRDLRAGGARVLAGTDTFDAFVLPGHSLHQELNLLVQAGLSPAEALDAATSEAARYRGSDEAEGTIAPGKRADLVLLDADPLSDIANASRVRATIVGGRLYDRAALDRLLEGVRAFAAAR